MSTKPGEDRIPSDAQVSKIPGALERSQPFFRQTLHQKVRPWRPPHPAKEALCLARTGEVSWAEFQATRGSRPRGAPLQKHRVHQQVPPSCTSTEHGGVIPSFYAIPTSEAQRSKPLKTGAALLPLSPLARPAESWGPCATPIRVPRRRARQNVRVSFVVP